MTSLRLRRTETDLTSGAIHRHLESPEHLDTDPETKPLEEPLSLFVSVFSARANKERRFLFRELWRSRQDEMKDKSVLRFALCQPDSQESMSVKKDIMTEQRTFDDLAIMDCEEGQERGKMALKAALAMHEYRHGNYNHSLFMHVEDDTFVAWNRLWTVLSGFKDMQLVYMGQEVPEGKPVNRDSQSNWYQSPEIYAKDSYPQYMKKECYILGKDLVVHLVDSNVIQENPLTNHDQALGVWVDLLKNQGTPVSALVVDPPSKNADGLPIPYSACGDTWSHYPFIWQHGISPQDMQCLSKWDVQDDMSQVIDSCLTDCEAVR